MASSRGWPCRTRRQLFSLREISTQNNCTDFFFGGGAASFCCVRLGTCVLVDAREWARGAGRDRRPHRALSAAWARVCCSSLLVLLFWKELFHLLTAGRPPQALCPRSTQAVAAAWRGKVTAGSPLCQSHGWWLRLGSRLSVHAGPRVGFSSCVLQFTVSSECIGLARPLRKVAASKYLLV